MKQSKYTELQSNPVAQYILQSVTAHLTVCASRAIMAPCAKRPHKEGKEK